MTAALQSADHAVAGLPVEVHHLGQSMLRVALRDAVIYTDPYLSNSVEALEGPDGRRLLPPPCAPHEVTDADWVLVSHDHLDHCDPDTLVPLAKASPDARFVGPQGALAILEEHGVAASRLVKATRAWLPLGSGVRVRAVIAAHPAPDDDADGDPVRAGFVLESEEPRVRLYFAGDSSPHERIVDELAALGSLDVAFLPVNERNHYKDQAGILGNMSVREAFAFAAEIGAPKIVPLHWDMFPGNSVLPAEVRVVFDALQPGFSLHMPHRAEL